jgi:hypothetical protein
MRQSKLAVLVKSGRLAPDERGYVVAARDWLSAESITLVLGAAIGLAFVVSFVLFRDAHLNGKSIDKTAAKALVERIIVAESNGDTNARNKRSSATGGRPVSR